MDDFRQLLYSPDHPRLAGARGLSAREFGDKVKATPRGQAMFWAPWEALAAEPFHGLTCDGQGEQGLFHLADEGAPAGDMVEAAARLLTIITRQQAGKLRRPIDSEAWRRWSNPEFLWNDNGLRLDECSAEVRDAVMAILRASLSDRGFSKARQCMITNAFLGELTHLPRIMNEYSYNFVLFGDPSDENPWGWNLYGHHLALNCFVLERQMIISPTFMGAEPNRIDSGPHAGLELFRKEEVIGLELMRSLAPGLRARARLYPVMQGPLLPDGRCHPADGLHLGGAFQDNRIVPYEGITAENFTSAQRDRLMELMAEFIGYLPDKPLAAKLRQIEAHLDRTHWCWIGGDGDKDPFYFRIQSPVIMMEFDHHRGVWLTNETPAKCHIHTVVRTPNGNDYGKDLLRQHYERVHADNRAPSI